MVVWALTLGLVLATSTAAWAITGTLTATPNPVDFTPQPWSNGGQQQSINIQNSGAATQVNSATFTGPDASRFYVAWGQNCTSQLFGPGWICGMGIGFNPPSHAGTFHAQLELSSDSASSPLIVTLNATALNGPHALSNPSQVAFGNVKIGKSVAQTVTVSNDGDWPMQVQGAFMVTGVASVLAIASDGCSGQTVNPGSSCQMSVSFAPTAVGYREGTVVFIAGNGGVTPIGFSGTGVPPVNGAATIAGNRAAGSTLTCAPVGYPTGTNYAYQWLKSGHVVAGASAPDLPLLDTDTGAHFSCRITASNAVDTQTVTSAQTAPIAPMTLTGEPGAFTDQGTCRTLQATQLLHLARHTVVVGHGRPTTPAAPLTLNSPVSLRVRVDGRTIGAGKTVSISPRALSNFADGSHTLQVTGAGNTSQSRLLLGPCSLAVRLDGGPRELTTLSASSRYGISNLTFWLPPGLDLVAGAARKLGWITFKSAGYPRRTFNLIGPRTTSNGVKIVLKRHAVTVTNLPSQTGVIDITLRPSVISGHGGIVSLAAHERGARTLRASTAASWLP